MDILSQYKKENPEAFQERKQAPIADEYGRAYSGMIAWVIRISGGRIRDARGASYALLGGIVVILIITAVVFLLSGADNKQGSLEKAFPSGSSVLVP